MRKATPYCKFLFDDAAFHLVPFLSEKMADTKNGQMSFYTAAYRLKLFSLTMKEIFLDNEIDRRLYCLVRVRLEIGLRIGCDDQ